MGANSKDGFPEHDEKTILNYDVGMLRDEANKCDENILRMQTEVNKLSITKKMLLMEHDAKKNGQKIKDINATSKVFEDEIRKIRQYKTRLEGYIIRINSVKGIEA